MDQVFDRDQYLRVKTKLGKLKTEIKHDPDVADLSKLEPLAINVPSATTLVKVEPHVTENSLSEENGVGADGSETDVGSADQSQDDSDSDVESIDDEDEDSAESDNSSEDGSDSEQADSESELEDNTPPAKKFKKSSADIHEDRTVLVTGACHLR